MLKLSVEHAFADGAPQPLAVDALQAELKLLPAAPLLAGERLLQRIKQLERCALDTGNRLSCLRVLQPVVQRQAEALALLASQGDPLVSVQARQAWQLARSLLRRWHEDCKLLAQALSEEVGGVFSSSRPQQEALGLALHSGWQLQLWHARSYTPLCKGFWLDCHRLFAQVLAQGWEARAPLGDSLGALYRQILLLGMTASNRLDAARQRLLQSLVLSQARYLQLEQLDWSLPADGAWVFSADGDSAARFVSELPPDCEGVWWRVDAARVLDKLQADALKQQTAGQIVGAELQLLARLEQEWRSPPQRRHLRLRRLSQESVELVSQLPQCWQLAHSGRLDGDAPAAARLQVCNLSASGVMLQGEATGQLLHAGEVVMLRRRGFGWQLGLVRWVSFPGEGLLTECGVEFIGKRPQAAMVSAITSHPGGQFEMALLVQAERQFRHGGVLVMPGRMYQAMRPLRIRSDGQERRVRALRLLQQTAAYQLMEIRVDEVLETVPDALD